MTKTNKRKRERQKEKRIAVTVLTVAVIFIVIVVGFEIKKIRDDKPRGSGGEETDKITVEEGNEPEDPKTAAIDITQISGYISKVSDGSFVGMTFPYQVPGSSMQILSAGQYTGPFIETGESIPTDNVMTIIVKNTGEKMIEYGEIQLSVGNETAVFKITALPTGTAVMVQELHQMRYSKDNTYAYKTALEANMEEEKDLQKDKVSISGEEGKLTVTNLTDEPISKLYICFHTIQSGGVYRGGITYRVAFENIGAGESQTIESQHYYGDYSSILFVDIPPEEVQ